MTYPLKSLLAATALSLTAGFAAPAMADAETDALKQEVKALEARINQLEKRNAKKEAHVYAAAPETAAANVPAQASVAQRLAIVERNQELAKEDAAAKAKTTPKIEVGSKGLVIASPDNQYSLNLHGYVQADDRTFFGNGATGPTNTFLIRSARPVFDAKMTDYFNARLMVDFGRGQTTLLDAYGDFHPMPQNDYVSLRIGEFKVPIGLERWQPESDVLFVERGQTTNLVPYRDIGVMAHGNLIPDQLEYELGITNGAADLQANNTDTDNNKDGVARIFAHPFQWTGVQALQGLGLGIGGTYGVHQGSPTAPGLVAGYASVGQRVYFAYRNAGGAGTTYADGPQWRVNPQGTYYNGPVRADG
jgi:phosphate-selective porin OprO/OprP